MKKAFILFSLLILVACQTSTRTINPETVTLKKPEQNTSVNSEVEKTLKPVVIVETKAPEPVKSAEPIPQDEAPQVAKLEIKVDDNPNQFLGANLSYISEHIGTPYFARRDGAIEVWQYQREWKAGTCHLDLFLYPESVNNLTAGKTIELKVKHSELRSQFLSKKDQHACFAEILKDQIRKNTIPVS